MFGRQNIPSTLARSFVLVWMLMPYVQAQDIIASDCSVVLNDVVAPKVTIKMNCPGNPGEPISRALSDQYIRLSGALEVPIIVQLQSNGGFDNCSPEMCHMGSSNDSADSSKEYEVQGGHISPAIAQSWSKWPFRKSLPLGTDLWRKVAGNGELGIDYLNQLEKGLGKCIDDKFLRPESSDETYGGMKSGATCKRSDSRRVGFLFWSFANNSNRLLTNVKIYYSTLADHTNTSDYLEQLSASIVGNTQTKVLPQLNAKQSTLMLLSVYERNTSGFESKFLEVITVPRLVTYEVGGKRFVHVVRAPLREKAVTVPMPLGWYLQ